MIKHNTNYGESQSPKTYGERARKLFSKLQIKKGYNLDVIEFLKAEREYIRADRIESCGTYLELVREGDIPKILRANFCRERLCHVCAWRKQSKFVAQVSPVLEELSAQGFEYIFVTLTLRNSSADDLRGALDQFMKAYNKFLGRKQIAQSFAGVIRSLEITYNDKEDTFHPHVHCLVAVDDDYFKNPGKYLSQKDICNIWKECAQVDYTPVCYVEKVTENQRAELETLKYCVKPSKHRQAIEVFYRVLKGRRLVSFSGVFAQYRKRIESEVERLTDNISPGKYTAVCYKFDPTGGVYKYYKTYEGVSDEQ